MRYYKSAKSGKIFPSVTSCLPEFMFGNQHAMDRGTAIHQACHYINQDRLDWDSLDDEILPYVEGYQLMLKETGMKVEQSELTVVSEKYRVAGTLDILGKLGKDYVLCDLKSGQYTQPLPNWTLQLSAYYRLYVEMSGDKKKRKLFAIVLNAEGSYRLFECDDPDAFTVFLSYLRIFNWEKRWS